MDGPATDERRPLLLHGVTGSGKTEVYLRAVAAALERGRSAIVLVPEIALTPQTAGRFVERFGDAVAVLHSRLSQRERYDEWWRLRRGEARVCVGPRSAVFAPFDDLGLIVVDEEHDGSYKQEGDPRYDARTVAERRAAERGRAAGGRAAPRRAPESVLRHERIVLPERVDGRRCRRSSSSAWPGVAGPLHERTRQALDEVRRRGEKAIVLLNRRGWSNFLSCRSCGRVWECPNCDVTLVLHRALAGWPAITAATARRVPRVLPRLRVGVGGAPRRGHRAARARAGGAGGAAAGVPARRRRRRGGRGGRPCCGASTRRPAGVLVGTQMVAKGHDFPDVTLGVVLDADATLRFPDFRAEERTFALVAQLAGRSGRGARGGRVIVQALDPSRARAALRRAPRRRGLPRRRAGAARAARLPAARAPDPRGVLGARRRGPELAAAAGRSRAHRGRRGAGARPGAAVPPPGRASARSSSSAPASARAAIAAVRRAVEARGGRARARARRLRRRRRPAVGLAEPLARSALDSAPMAEERRARGRGRGRARADEERRGSIPRSRRGAVAAMSFIRRLGDPVLKSRATPVDRFDDSLRQQVARMAGIMNDALGVGLAAPQLGLSQRLLVYRVGQTRR